MVILDSSNPKRLINVYLELLIEELQNLWYMGVLTHNSMKNEIFLKCATLMWTVNDLSAYGTASGWSSTSVMRCPVVWKARAFHL
ncbi:UNVERIFIED_CONTAM: hypothetical protein Sindi_1985200 [Sesamum indicum]